MQILAIDDESLVLESLVYELKELFPSAEITALQKAEKLSSYLKKHTPDIVFLDIQIGGVNGMEIAKKLKAVCPSCNIVFCTAYAEYAVDAFQLAASDYLLKPVTQEKLRHAIKSLRCPPEFPIPADQLFVRCFGEFEVFWQGKPLSLSKRAKELFAWLVDKSGAMCTTSDILAKLFPNCSDVNYRLARKTLLTALKEIGQEDAVFVQWGAIGVHVNRIFCDYYEYQKGNPAAANLYQGVYMSQYPWAQFTAKYLKHF